MQADELVQVGKEIVEQARALGAEVRLFGGAAVYARCPSIAAHLPLQRMVADLDLIAPVSAWKALPDIFIGRGFRMKFKRTDHATFSREGLTIDVWGTRYRDFYAFDFAPRLIEHPLTLPLVDLLLLKLQRVEFREQDIQDSIALLLDHPVAGPRDTEAIDREYLYRLTNRNWGLWTTVFDNTVKLEHILDRYLNLEQSKLTWRRIELIQEVMDGKGKSLRWWLRAVPSKHFKWYDEPPREAPEEKVQVRT